jgi:hypothetical protein
MTMFLHLAGLLSSLISIGAFLTSVTGCSIGIAVLMLTLLYLPILRKPLKEVVRQMVNFYYKKEPKGIFHVPMYDRVLRRAILPRASLMRTLFWF